MSGGAIERLARLHGIGERYHDYRGELRHFSRETTSALLSAMGVDVSTDVRAQAAIHQHETLQWARMLSAVHVSSEGRPCEIEVSIPQHLGARVLNWVVTLESGARREGTARLDTLSIIARIELDRIEYVRMRLVLPQDLPSGYHVLGVTLDSGLDARSRVIVSPAKCFEPAVIKRGERVWGIAVQLYSLRSEQNWGIGDFHDLAELIRIAAPLGCSVIGVNPLHALMPANPVHISPYSPSNREFLNVLYIAVPDVPDFHESAQARAHAARPDFEALLAQLRNEPHVDYVRLARAKFEVLRLCYESFHDEHLAKATPRAHEFRRFVEERGEPLRLHAIYDALDSHLRLQGPQYWGWPSWPEEYRDPRSAAVNRFARERARDVEYFLYLQWLAENQLWSAQRVALECGMSIGLYGDVAVGANAGGSESWSNRELYLRDAAIGAPPDALALKGQDWGIPPQSPGELRAQEYQPFIELLRSNMREVAALRLDHVMTLCRLWWVPRGFTSTDGAYVHYPLEELIAILALESQRNHCVVIGEDLGTVPDLMRDAMERYGVYHYKVLLFEKESDGRFKAPGQYVRHALATVATHDLPTLRGWWDELDLELRDRLDLYPSPDIRRESHAARSADRIHLMHALVAARLWQWRSGEPLPPFSPALSRAVHAFLGLSNANMTLIQIEDLIGMADPVNVPGTDTEYPNWQRKVVMNTAEIFARTDVLDLLDAMRKARRGENPNGE